MEPFVADNWPDLHKVSGVYQEFAFVLDNLVSTIH